MRCKCRVLSVAGIPASDGSIVSQDVMESYLRSDECQKALEMHKMIGSLSHRARALNANFPDTGATLSKVVGKDDSMIIVSDKAPTPTHYVDKMYIEDGWLICEIELLDESVMDDFAAQNIKRLKGMLRNGILPGVSAVIVGFWQSDNGTHGDYLKKLVQFKGIDVTLNPSWKAATILDVQEDENADSEKEFSEIEYTPDDFKFSGVKVKAFSDLSSIYSGPKSSKIDGQYTTLKAKVFSADGVVEEMVIVPEDEVQKEFTEEEPKVEEQKEFTQARVREELREMKMGLRMSFRRCLLSYRQAIKSMGGAEKIDPEDLKTLKSMLNAEVLMILNKCTDQVIEGKQINTLLGTSSISKNLRVAGQKLQLPLRQAHLEARKQGYVTKMRYQKLQAAYLDFTKAVIEDVFGPESDKMNLEEEGGEE